MIFKYICTVFISPYESSDVDFARSKLQELIQERPQTRSDNERILFKATRFDQSSNEFNQQDQKEEQDFEDEEERFKRQYSHSVKENSPFTVHFLDTQKSINYKSESSNVNTLVNQSFVEFLQKEFMPYIFLWGGFVLRDQEFDKPTTHMVDSSVEAWFRTRKNLIDGPISPARYINETIHETLGQCKRSSKHLVSEDENEENNPVEATKFNALDIWGKKKKLLTFKKKNKGGVYQVPAITLSKHTNSQVISLKEALSKNATGNDLITNGKLSAFRIKPVTAIDTSQLVDSTNSSQIVVKALGYRINGVDIDAATLNEHLLINTVMLNDNTIDAYLQCISNKDKTKYIASSFHLSTIVLNGKCSSKKQLTGFEVVCGPVFHENVKHWTFLFLNMKRKEIIHLDPLNNSPTHQAKYVDNILKFFKSRKEYSGLEFTHRTIKHPTQADGVSCGVFVCMFAKILLSSYDYVVDDGKMDFKIEGARNEIYNTIVSTASRI